MEVGIEPYQVPERFPAIEREEVLLVFSLYVEAAVADESNGQGAHPMTAKYSYEQDDGFFILKRIAIPVQTPKGKVVKTTFKELADRLVRDMERYGESPTDPVSIVAFHYAMLDFFLTMDRRELEHSVAIGLDSSADWTLSCPAPDPHRMMEWWGHFGREESQIEKGKEWLRTLDLRELCAVCVLGRGLESVNIPFILATAVPDHALEDYATFVNQRWPFVGLEDMKRYFDNFLFYFRLHPPGE